MSPENAPAGDTPDESTVVDQRGRLGEQLDALGRAASGRIEAVRGTPGVGTWTGLALVLAGVSVLVLGWSRAADLGVVALQLPYLISAGGAGIGLIVVGLAVVAISANVTDAAGRRRQLAELRETMAAIRAALEDDR